MIQLVVLLLVAYCRAAVQQIDEDEQYDGIMLANQTECEADITSWTWSTVDRTNVCEATRSICIDLAYLMDVEELDLLLDTLGCDYGDDSCMCNKLKSMYEPYDKQDKTRLLILMNMTHATTCPAIDDRSDDDKHAYQMATIMCRTESVKSENCQAKLERVYKGDVKQVHYFMSTTYNTVDNNVVVSIKVRCVLARTLHGKVHCNSRMNWHFHKNCTQFSGEQSIQCMFDVVQALYDQARSPFEIFFFGQIMGFGECMRDETVNPSSLGNFRSLGEAHEASLECLTNIAKPEVPTCIIGLNNKTLKLADIYRRLSCNSFLLDKLKCVSTGCSCDYIARVFAKVFVFGFFRNFLYINLGVEVVPATPSDQLMKVHMKDVSDLFIEVAKGKRCIKEKKQETVADNFNCSIQIDKSTSTPGIRHRIKSGQCFEINNFGLSNDCYPKLKKFLPEAVKLFTSGNFVGACARIQSFYDRVQPVIALKFLLEDVLKITACA